LLKNEAGNENSVKNLEILNNISNANGLEIEQDIEEMEEITDRDEIGFELPHGGISGSLVVGDSNFEETEIQHVNELEQIAEGHGIREIQWWCANPWGWVG